jgi:8-oxo-dGTP pyrophosphatase MutT (NUDIX family)
MNNNKYSNVQCGNCGIYGHIYKNCNKPILSYGIIGFKKFKQKNDQILKNNMFNSLNCNEDDFIIKYLLIRRKDSLSYCDFLRGRYDIEDSNMIIRFLTDMTIDERSMISTTSFDLLWKNLWINTENKSYHNDYLDSSIKFNTLKNGYEKNNIYYSLDTYLSKTSSKWNSPEWGFPKGRRNIKENDYDCAIREFKEETGLTDDDFKICSNNVYTEVFEGNNNKMYSHVYYLAEIHTHKIPIIDSNNTDQIGEISKIGYYTFEDSYDLFNREDNKERRTILTEINDFLT